MLHVFRHSQGMHEQLHLEPYAVHTTFQYAGTEGKRNRLREAMLFVDQPSYYDSPGGFISFKPNIPKRLLLDGAHTVESHFALVNYQIHVMLKDLPEEEFGPHIDFREYSFLENPSLPKQVKESLLEVQLCDDHNTGCSAANETSEHRPLLLPKNSTDQELLHVFSSYKNVKIIQFSSMVDAFRGFSDAAVEKKFRNRVKRYVGLWCCVQFREIGHIYYDMYWDEKSGWKPHPPETREEDHPPLS
ncbi:hypothetical protein PR202_ga12577 [Eleusine coracana subsp. coracana]|uniref:Uncharacterized protein n=1 Tax=Eleusine coracana subsp. coracana TaxID=191504 RepID=A0AAV5CCH8_ELECO|nr:hypothetical protein PR202_ga12577 [Eleusine coracana subsp. coracana]